MTTFFQEPTRPVPLVEECDVLVAGGGPAGVMAAVAAARRGVRVRLVEAQGALGGIWTSGCLPHIIAFSGQGLSGELAARLAAAGAGRPGCRAGGEPPRDYDVETFKCVLDRLAADAGVRVRLYTRVSTAWRESDGRLGTVVTDSPGGREAWRARVFIDCTGDGDLAARAGCSFEIGEPGTGRCQPTSMMAVLAGAGRPDQPPFNIAERRAAKDWLLAEMRRAGHDPSYGQPTMFLVRDNLVIMMATHQYGYRGPDAQWLSEATAAGRAENLAITRALRARGGQWAALETVAQSALIGVRESRRIAGLYRLTRDDLAAGARFPDAVCRVSFCIDIHALDPARNRGIDPVATRVRPYDIPRRALISREVPNLLLAGRCISGDFYAHASYRVSGAAAAMGEAAGVIAALAAARGRRPAAVPFGAVRGQLPPL